MHDVLIPLLTKMQVDSSFQQMKGTKVVCNVVAHILFQLPQGRNGRCTACITSGSRRRPTTPLSHNHSVLHVMPIHSATPPSRPLTVRLNRVLPIFFHRGNSSGSQHKENRVNANHGNKEVTVRKPAALSQNLEVTVTCSSCSSWRSMLQTA